MARQLLVNWPFAFLPVENVYIPPIRINISIEPIQSFLISRNLAFLDTTEGNQLPLLIEGKMNSTQPCSLLCFISYPTLQGKRQPATMRTGQITWQSVGMHNLSMHSLFWQSSFFRITTLQALEQQIPLVRSADVKSSRIKGLNLYVDLQQVKMSSKRAHGYFKLLTHTIVM